MSDEDFIFNRYTLANERMAGDLHPPANFCPLLDLDEGSHPAFVADLAALQIHKCIDLYIRAQFNICGNSCKFGRYHVITS